MLAHLLLHQELQKAKADFTVVFEGFFNGAFAAKGVDRSRVVVGSSSALSTLLKSAPFQNIVARKYPAMCVVLLDSKRVLKCVLRQDMLLGICTEPEPLLAPADVEQGLKVLLDTLDQTAVDVPFAPKLVSASSACTQSRSVAGCLFRAKCVWADLPVLKRNTIGP
jgi:hypothetical protein